mmetsp:Transcript_72604/g.210156  ORF Transcript_72604/g.210156 Transcript_72604/m.210156 type:complete len:211 (-) Transcript_72604:865-1497(-)
MVASPDHRAQQAALHDVRAGPRHVGRISDRRRRVNRDAGRLPLLGQRLACDGRALDQGAVGAIEDAHVRRNPAAGLQQYDVAREEVLRRQLQRQCADVVHLAKCGDALRALHALQGVHRRLGLLLRPPLEHARGDDDHRQDRWGDEIVAAHKQSEEKLHDDAEPKQDIKDSAEHLPGEQPQRVRLLWRRHRVAAEYAELRGECRLVEAPR